MARLQWSIECLPIGASSRATPPFVTRERSANRLSFSHTLIQARPIVQALCHGRILADMLRPVWQRRHHRPMLSLRKLVRRHDYGPRHLHPQRRRRHWYPLHLHNEHNELNLSRKLGLCRPNFQCQPALDWLCRHETASLLSSRHLLALCRQVAS